MKYISLTEEVSQDCIEKDLSKAHSIGKVYLGNEILFYKKGFKYFYIPLSNVYRAFRRIKAVSTSLCCGKGEIQLQFLVLCSKKDELAEFDLPDERSAIKLLEELQQKAPKIKIGKKN